MIKHIRTFFYPNSTTYYYELPKEVVVSKVDEVLNRKKTFLDTNDLSGKFTDKNIFSLWLLSGAHVEGGMMKSSLVGHIVESQNGQTVIDLKERPAPGLYIWFFISIAAGLAYLYKFVQTGSLATLFKSIGILVGGTVLCIRISQVAILAIRERYLTYLDKKIRAI
jgi:hypothetical protein